GAAPSRTATRFGPAGVLASVFPSEFIPDTPEGGVKALDQFFADQPEATRTHAIMAWAAEYSLLSYYLKSQEGFSKTIAYGHSRFAKAALVAGAFDPTIDAVVAHQSGTGGASLSRDKTGEGLDSISENYPHWFLPKFATYAQNKAALPLDQHFLLALMAPRPMFLGNARRDVWSDPNGAFRAAEAASAAYGLYGQEGLHQKTLKDFDPTADIAFWLRPGTHGVVKEDWPAFLEFLDAHFK
ncbi:MAG: alpha/beta hydrolase, partial [Robiginitomaculum sp.]